MNVDRWVPLVCKKNWPLSDFLFSVLNFLLFRAYMLPKADPRAIFRIHAIPEHYNLLPFYQFITNTHFMDGLPSNLYDRQRNIDREVEEFTVSSFQPEHCLIKDCWHFVAFGIGTDPKWTTFIRWSPIFFYWLRFQCGWSVSECRLLFICFGFSSFGRGPGKDSSGVISVERLLWTAPPS